MGRLATGTRAFGNSEGLEVNVLSESPGPQSMTAWKPGDGAMVVAWGIVCLDDTKISFEEVGRQVRHRHKKLHLRSEGCVNLAIILGRTPRSDGLLQGRHAEVGRGCQRALRGLPAPASLR